MDVYQRPLRSAQIPLQGLQGRGLIIPEDRQLPQPSGIQVPEQTHHLRYPLLGKAETVRG